MKIIWLIWTGCFMYAILIVNDCNNNPYELADRIEVLVIYVFYLTITYIVFERKN